MLNKLRTAILIVFASYIGFVVAGMALVGMMDDSPMIPLMRTQLAPSVAMTFVQAGAGIALLAVIIGGMPLAITIIRRALTADRANRNLLLVPVYSLLALGVYLSFILLVGTGRIHLTGVVQAVQPGNFPIGNKIMLAGMMVIFILGAVASTLAVWKVVARTDVEQATFQLGNQALNIKIYQFAYLPAIIAACAMVLMSVGTIVWSVLVFSALPQVYTGNYGPWQTNTQAWLYGIITLMVICSAAAFLGIAHGRSAMAKSYT